MVAARAPQSPRAPSARSPAARGSCPWRRRGSRLEPDLLPVADRVVGAEGDQATVGHDLRDAALAQLADIERVGVLEVLDDDHEAARRDLAQLGRDRRRAGDALEPRFDRAAAAGGLRRPQALERRADVEVGDGAVGDVVEVALDVDQARQRDEVLAVVEREGRRAAGRRAAGNRDEVVVRETTRGAARRPPRSRRSWSACRSGSASARNRPEWVTGWKKTPVTAGCSTPKRTIAPTSSSLIPRSTAAASETLTPASAQRSSARSFSSVSGAAADRPLGLLLEAVELQVDVDADLGQGGREARVAGEPDAVGVQHHQRDAALASGAQHRRGSAGWIDGSPPESWTDSGSPSARTKASSIDSTCSRLEREAVLVRDRSPSRRSRSGSRGCRRC